MYTYKHFCFGIDLNKSSVSEDVRNFIRGYLFDSISSRGIHLESFYHGGITSNDDYFTGYLGYSICDDTSTDYIKQVRSADQSEYGERWKKDIDLFVEHLKDILGELEESYEDGIPNFKSIKAELLELVTNTDPEFYHFEQSS